MSGGHFDYKQHHIEDIADSIQSLLDRQGKEIPREDRWYSDDWYNEHPEYETYSKKTQKEFRNAIKHLRIAAIYAQRVDWFISGDDGEENFHSRLKDDLNNLKNNEHRKI